MAQYDGSIRIGTGIDEKGFKAGSKELEAGARSLAKSVSDSLGEGAKIALQKQTDAFVKLNQQYAVQEQKVKDIAAKLHDVQRQRIETAEFKELSKDLDKAKASLDRLYDRRDSYVELGKKVPPKLDLDISDAERKIRLLEGDIKELQLTNKAYIPADTSKVQQELAMAEQKQMQMYTALQTAADSLSQKTSERVEKEEAVREKIAAEAAEEERLDQIRVNAVATNDQIIAKVERLKQLEKEIADLKAAGTTEGYADYDNRIIEADQLKQDIRDYRDSLSEVPEKFSRMRETAKKAFNAISTGLSTIGKIGKKAFSGIFSIAKKMFSSITSGTKKSNGLFSTFASRLKGIALSLLIFNWISKGFNAMISGMKKGFENLAGYSDSYAQSVQSMKNAMSTLGNQFAAAFAPIVQMVIPWINSLINSLTTAMTYVAQFIAVLGGKGTFTKAKQQQDAYNKSLGGTAKAADKARGALAKFDDLDVLQKQEDTSGGGGANETDPSDMFEEVEIEDKWENIADWFREMWENSDFYELGNLLGTKLAEALSSINWGPIKKAAEGIGKSIGTLINGFVETDNLGASIGQTIGNAISTGISGINAFLDNTHWDSVGVFIGEALNGLVNAISWEDIGHFFAEKWNAIFSVIGEAARTFEWSNFGLELSNGINTAISDFDWAESGARLGDLVKGILDTIIAFFENTNWQELGNNVATFIGSIDWTGLFEKLSQGIGAALGGLAAFLWGLIEDAWSNVISWWNEVAFEDGKFTITGLLNGIGEGLRNICTWIYEHIFQPFIEGFKNAFGIHSPSTVMIEMGHFLMEGLFNGISSLVNKVVSVFEKLKNKIVGVWNTVKEKTTEIWAGIVNQIKKPINVILGFMETLSNGVIAAMNFMIQALNKLSFDVPDWIPGIGGKTFGFNLTELKEVSIPRLATGAVIRGGNPFMAILGDQPAGQTNIEAPLATIEKALENVMSRNGYAKESVPVTINLNYDGETFARLSISDILSELDRQGYNVNVLGVT